MKIVKTVDIMVEWVNTAFLINVDIWQLTRQMSTYIEKKHYHVSKNVADVSFVWHPDTLLQPNDILVGTSLSCRKYH